MLRVTLVVHFEAHSSKRTRHDAGVVRSPGRHVRAEVRTRGRALHRSRSATTRTKSRAPPAPTRRRSKLVTNTRPDAPPLFRRRCSSDRPPRESRRARMESRRAVVRGSVSQVASGSGGDETCHAPDTGTSASRENLHWTHRRSLAGKTTVRLCLLAKKRFLFRESRLRETRARRRATPRDAVGFFWIRSRRRARVSDPTLPLFPSPVVSHDPTPNAVSHKKKFQTKKRRRRAPLAPPRLPRRAGAGGGDGDAGARPRGRVVSARERGRAPEGLRREGARGGEGSDREPGV